MDNKIYIKIFDPEEKAKAFDRIAEHYYQRNFGTMAKSDLETLLFDIYIERLLDEKENFDDYTMSKQLGITQSRVRTLKAKKELQYPRQGFDWKGAFVEEVSHARYDDITKTVEIPVHDVNVMTELRYYMECHGWFDEYHLNPRLMQCKLDFFLNLCNSFTEEGIFFSEEAREKLRKIKGENTGKIASAIEEIASGSIKDGLKNLIMFSSRTIMLEVLKLIPFGGLAEKAVMRIIEAIENQ